jgi:hypothetical protein
MAAQVQDQERGSMKTVLVSIVLVVLFSLPASAAVDCLAFEKAIDGTLKSIALDLVPASGRTDYTRITAHWSEIQVNLQLMEANKCTMPPVPLHGGRYLVQALECSTAMMKASLAGTSMKDLPECDTEKWIVAPPAPPVLPPAGG